MSALTQEKLNALKRLLHYPNDPMASDIFWRNREPLIAAAEEGLKAKVEIADNLKALEESAVLVNKLDNEKQDLRARVQELEGILRGADNALSNAYNLGYASAGGFKDKQSLYDRDEWVRAKNKALSNSTPQPAIPPPFHSTGHCDGTNCSRSNMCLSGSEDNISWCCTLPANHTGPHIACTFGLHNLSTWPNSNEHSKSPS